MSHSPHHGSHRDASNPEACGSRVRASRDHQAETSGQAATTTHTLDRHHATYPPGPGQTRIGPSDPRPASAPGTLLACPTSAPSPADVAISGRPDDALARHGAPTPLTAAPSGGRATSRSAGRAAVTGTSSAHTRRGARNSARDHDGPVHKDIAGLRRGPATIPTRPEVPPRRPVRATLHCEEPRCR